MKGTLFSADFVKDFNGNLRLLEINTDTGFVQSSLQYFDFTEFANVLTTNSISKVHIIYKLYADEFVELFENYLKENVPQVDSIIKTVEEADTIYPTSIVDSQDTFILRLAYDQSAIFDSSYCANTVGTYKLFHENNDLTSIAEFSYNSDDFSFNNLPVRFNPSNLPDFVAKGYSSAYPTVLEFHKVGTDSTLGASDADKLQNYLDTFSSSSTVVQPFYNNSSDSKSKAIRCYSVLYGDSLDMMTLASFETEALLEKPVAINFDATSLKNVIDVKHYYELTTNYIKSSDGGVFQGEEIIKADDTAVLIENAVIGDLFKSFSIPGSPDSDAIDVISKWRFAGSMLPSGSAQVESTLVGKVENNLITNLISNVTLEDGSSFKLSTNLLILVYDIDEDSLRYQVVSNIDPAKFKIPSMNNELLSITSNNIEVLDGEYATYTLDMEDVDTFFINNGGVGLKLISHNAFGKCFIAGTKITLSNGDVKDIENIVEGDIVVSYNESLGIQEDKEVTSTVSPVHDDLVKYTFSNGTDITSTHDHPFYVNDFVLAAYKPELTNERYDLSTTVTNIKVGDIVHTVDNEDSIQIVSIEELPKEDTQTYIFSVEGNRNFYANGILVHNK